MKIALITDTHFGARGDNQVFDQFFEKFYSKIFFPVLDKLEIRQVIHLGDTFDRRKFISYVTLSACQRYFFDQLAGRDIGLTMIVGNHDIAYKNTLEVNSPSLLVGQYENISVIGKPVTLPFHNTNILLVPWMCADNAGETMDMLKDSKAQIVMGHLDVTGFEMYRGQVNTGGYDASLFSRFESVYTGHFHHRSTKGNITYLGNPYEITWSDYNDPRGFHIFDTETRAITFIENPYRMFYKIAYDETGVIDPSKIDVKPFADRFVKVIVSKKTDQQKFDGFIDRLYNINPVEIKILENSTDYDDDAIDGKTVDVEDTITLLEKYVDSIELDLDKEKFKTFLKSLYIEAQALEEERI